VLDDAEVGTDARGLGVWVGFRALGNYESVLLVVGELEARGGFEGGWVFGGGGEG
jgi:hypothetical protein